MVCTGGAVNKKFPVDILHYIAPYFYNNWRRLYSDRGGGVRNHSTPTGFSYLKGLEYIDFCSQETE